MTYGEFAWKDLMRSALRDRSRDHDEPPTVFVPGQPIAAGYAGEARWSYKVQQAVRRRLARPRLAFVVAPSTRARPRFSLRGLAAPIVAVVATDPRSVWVQVATGDRLGVAVGAARPSFPPRIDRLVELGSALDPAANADLRAEAATHQPVGGDAPLGLHVTLRGPVVDLRDRGPVALLLSALSPLLGRSPGPTGEERIDDLRLLADARLEASAEIRLWLID